MTRPADLLALFLEGRDGALVLRDAALDLAPDADLQADLTLDLSDPEQVPYEVGFRVARASIPALAASLDVDPQLADGSLTAAGVIVGRLRGEESPFCSESQEECWSRNRRGHFVVTAK